MLTHSTEWYTFSLDMLIITKSNLGSFWWKITSYKQFGSYITRLIISNLWHIRLYPVSFHVVLRFKFYIPHHERAENRRNALDAWNYVIIQYSKSHSLLLRLSMLSNQSIKAHMKLISGSIIRLFDSSGPTDTLRRWGSWSTLIRVTLRSPKGQWDKHDIREPYRQWHHSCYAMLH